MLTHNPRGNYSFVPSNATFSAGAVADPGHAMVHAIFFRPLPLLAAFEAIEAHLTSIGRPMQAIAGLELRSPKPFTPEGFAAFNKIYIGQLRHYDMYAGDKGMAARSNLAPEPLAIAPAEPSIYAFTYTMPEAVTRPQFVVAGCAEIDADGKLARPGESNAGAMREKAIVSLRVMNIALKTMGVSVSDATSVNLYCVHPVDGYLHDDILVPLGAAAIHGVHLHYTRPPITTIEFEIDARSVAREIIL